MKITTIFLLLLYREIFLAMRMNDEYSLLTFELSTENPIALVSEGIFTTAQNSLKYKDVIFCQGEK